MTKNTPQQLKKLEDHLFESGYEVRYEKGNFKSGYCILEAKKLVMVNKFSAIETRINSLMEIINILEAQQKMSNHRAELFSSARDEGREARDEGGELSEEHSGASLDNN